MSGRTICICGGTFTMCEDGHAIDCPASNQFDRYKAMMGGPAACLTTPPARSYADGVEDAAKVALKHGGMLSLAQGHDDAEGQADRWYEGGKHSAQVIAAAIRLLSRGGKA